MSFHDAEILSAYLDGQLSPTEGARLETRLASDAGLQAVLEQLRQARGVLRQLPRRRAPRNFTLSPLDARIRAPVPALFPVLRFASVLASLLFLSAIAINGLTPPATARLAAAPVPAYGAGGGPGEGPSAADAAAPTEALATELARKSFVAAQPTEAASSETSAATAPALLEAPPAVPGGALSKSATSAAEPLPEGRVSNGAPIPTLWEMILGSAAVLFGLLAWTLRHSNQRNFRNRWLEK
jgi:hypothetical protein